MHFDVRILDYPVAREASESAQKATRVCTLGGRIVVVDLDTLLNPILDTLFPSHLRPPSIPPTIGRDKTFPALVHQPNELLLKLSSAIGSSITLCASMNTITNRVDSLRETQGGVGIYLLNVYIENIKFPNVRITHVSIESGIAYTEYLEMRRDWRCVAKESKYVDKRGARGSANQSIGGSRGPQGRGIAMGNNTDDIKDVSTGFIKKNISHNVSFLLTVNDEDTLHGLVNACSRCTLSAYTGKIVYCEEEDIRYSRGYCELACYNGTIKGGKIVIARVENSECMCRHVSWEMSGFNDGVKPGSARFDSHLHFSRVIVMLSTMFGKVALSVKEFSYGTAWYNHPWHVWQSDIFFVEVSVPRMKQNGHKWTPRCGSPLFGEISLDRSSTAAARPPLSSVPSFIDDAEEKKEKKRWEGSADGVVSFYELCQRKVLALIDASLDFGKITLLVIFPDLVQDSPQIPEQAEITLSNKIFINIKCTIREEKFLTFPHLGNPRTFIGIEVIYTHIYKLLHIHTNTLPHVSIHVSANMTR
ncbi:hypothetical protein EAG_03332 [Camponotus floridanus]|uniref:Uncharacterized protein n=1 Tax=Camponotus floridanus TaxID=104421 RepID=E1ZWT3_CAMFO|nr:hypothetical protein EAG_03332 [Camponotus floridanus]